MGDSKSSQLLIILDDLDKWNPYFPTDQVISAKDYLFSHQYLDLKHANIINLCFDSGYMSLGHYCSMIAEARGHKIMPTIKVMNDLQKSSFYLSDLDFLKEKVNKTLSQISGLEERESFTALSIFGKSEKKELDSITKSIFRFFPAPLLEIRFKKNEQIWSVSSLKVVSLDSLPKEQEDFFANTIDHFSNHLWRTPANRKKYVCDLAILVTKDEALPPSDEKALQKFEKACRKLDVFCERIYEDDFARINEFDALFVRTTTSIENFTYNFVKNAEMDGLVVIDDSDSILRCTNKIYVSNKLEKKGISTIPGKFIVKDLEEEKELAIEKYGFPLICKIPDGSFSIGVKKADNREELDKILAEMFQKSSLVLVQKFLRSAFDWRIGVLDNQPIFACKYYMSQGHWQIYNHSKGINTRMFSGKSETLPLYEVPKPVIKLAISSTSTIGNGLYGVDIKEDEEGNVYVVEINDNPNIDSDIEDKVEKDLLYETIVQSFLKRVRESRTV